MRNIKVVIDEKLIELYPISQFVILPSPSTTNDLASFFEKPLIMYDFLGLTLDKSYPREALERIKIACSYGGKIVYSQEELSSRLSWLVRSWESQTNQRANLLIGLDPGKCF